MGMAGVIVVARNGQLEKKLKLVKNWAEINENYSLKGKKKSTGASDKKYCEAKNCRVWRCHKKSIAIKFISTRKYFPASCHFAISRHIF